jgi:hypothetical protein
MKKADFSDPRKAGTAKGVCWKKPGYRSTLVCLVCMFSILVIVPYKLTRQEGIEIAELFNTSDWPVHLGSNTLWMPQEFINCWKKPGYGSTLVCLVCMFSILVIVPYKLTREEGIEVAELF